MSDQTVAIAKPANVRMAPNYTITLGGTSELITSRPRLATAKPAKRVGWVVDLYNRSDAHRKIIGHVIFLALGLLAAMCEILANFSPVILTVTQFVLPAIVQEVYDFRKQL